MLYRQVASLEVCQHRARVPCPYNVDTVGGIAVRLSKIAYNSDNVRRQIPRKSKTKRNCFQIINMIPTDCLYLVIWNLRFGIFSIKFIGCLFIMVSTTLGNHKGLPLQCRHHTVTVLYPLTTRDNHLKNLMANP